MTNTLELQRYLAEVRQRLLRLAVARGTAALAITALSISVAAVWVIGRLGFPGDLVIAARLVLLTAIGIVAWRLVYLPRRRLEADVSGEIERRAGAFDGRLATFAESSGTGSALRELLAEESLQIAERHPPEAAVPRRELGTAWSAAGISASILLLLAIAGPGNFAYGIRDLWVGWALPGLLPPQGIAVTPGDSGIRLGANLRIAATPSGFDPADATVHVRFAGRDWQQAAMTPDDGEFEFTFFTVRSDLEYYVAAGSVRSPSYAVEVVDLPEIENLALTYTWPAWTGRAPETVDPGGDVRAIADTEVTVTVTMGGRMVPAELVVDERAIRMDTRDTTGTAAFTVEADGRYFVAARVGSERIRLTDDYFIRVEEDRPPTVEFVRPGRDWSASMIEEVTAGISAKDDLRLESLELHYSVNGAGWQRVALDAAQAAEPVEHVFYLESLGGDERLEPGDLVSYYAVAGDRDTRARTDIFFIDVQPFDRRYSQSQAAGGAMGAQGGQQDEISARQREIIISTWNLVREQGDAGRGDDAYVRDNAALLARLQDTLGDQVATMVQRSQARRLTANDEEIARFVEHLEAAGRAMRPAAGKLGELELQDALLLEQEALRHLLAAEAVFTDISVSLQANNRGAAGGQAGRDLQNMLELEMDLEKNQYETGSRATPEQPQQIEDLADELAELARRQEQLARNQSAGTPLPEQRWQQQQLRREVEELRERLEQLARNQQSQPGAKGQSQAGSRAGGEPGSETRRRMETLDERLSSAVRAMNEANAAEASRQLGGAREEARRARQDAMRDAFETLAERADGLHETQQEIDERLQDAVQSALAGEAGPDELDSGLSLREEAEIAASKREMLAELQALQQEAMRAARDIESEQPDTADAVRNALDDVRDDEVEARLSLAATYIENGAAVYVAGSESAVTDALRRLGEELRGVSRRVADRVGRDALEAGGLEQALAEARSLRRQLEAGPGSEVAEALGTRTRAIGRDIREALRDVPVEALSSPDAAEIRRLADQLRIADFGRDPARIADDVRDTLSLVEQAELALRRAVEGAADGLRASPDGSIPAEHREIVADYYRRLAGSGTGSGDTP